MSDQVKVVALSSYEEKKKEFIEQVASLRQKFFQSIAPGGLVGERLGVVPASGFSFSAQKIWKVIKENKDLDLPAHKVMVATVRCEEIANEKYSSFVSNEGWLELEEAVQSHLVLGFGKKLSSLIYSCLSSYDEDVTYFEDSARSAKRKQLEEKLMQLVQPGTKLMLKHIRSETLNGFEVEFNNALNEGQGFALAARDCTKKSLGRFHEQYEGATYKQANWDFTKIRNKVSQQLDSHIRKVRAAKLKELTTLYESIFKKALCSQIEALLKQGCGDTWSKIRGLFHCEVKTTISKFSSALSSFEINEQETKDMISKLKKYARDIVEGKAREEVGKVKFLMDERFSQIFCFDDDSTTRDWKENHDIQAIAKTAMSSTLELLSVLAAIRLESDGDRIWHTLKKGTSGSPDLLSSSSWEEVPTEKTLITPAQCKELWDCFRGLADYKINQAKDIQKRNKKSKRRELWKGTVKLARKVYDAKVSIAVVSVGGGLASGVTSVIADASVLTIVASSAVVPAVAGVLVGTAAVVLVVALGKNMIRPLWGRQEDQQVNI